MSYATIERRLDSGDIVILDGGTGTELERRGLVMDPGAWCGPTTLENTDMLEQVHRDYIAAGADIITANTFASSLLMLSQSGYADRFETINKTAIAAALKARADSGRADVAVAGSLSHMFPVSGSTDVTDLSRLPSRAQMDDAFGRLADLHRSEGCDMILLEMMYHPDRMEAAFAAATATGLPVWAGFSAKRGTNGEVLSFARDQDIPFSETVKILGDFDIKAAGIMHTPSNIIGDALAVLADAFDGPLTAYPDSGYFKMPEWQFENIIPPEEFLGFAKQWVKDGARVVGGCCGLSPDHIAVLGALRGGKGG